MHLYFSLSFVVMKRAFSSCKEFWNEKKCPEYAVSLVFNWEIKTRPPLDSSLPTSVEVCTNTILTVHHQQASPPFYTFEKVSENTCLWRSDLSSRFRSLWSKTQSFKGYIRSTSDWNTNKSNWLRSSHHSEKWKLPSKWDVWAVSNCFSGSAVPLPPKTIPHPEHISVPGWKAAFYKWINPNPNPYRST